MRDTAADHDNDSLEPTVVPKPLPCDVKRLSLGRHDGFVLSQIDGQSSLEDLASLTGLTPTEVGKIVVRLHGFGAVSVPGRASPRKTKAPPAARRSTKPPPRRSTKPPARRSTLPLGRRAIPPTKSEPPKSLPPKSVGPKSLPPKSVGPESLPPRSLPSDCVPRLTSKSQRPLQIDMKDAYVLAQIDGSTSLGELVAIAGLDLKALTKALGRLERVGAVALSPPSKDEERSGSKHRAAISVEEVFMSARAHAKSKHTRRPPPEPPSSRQPAPRSVRSRTLAPPKPSLSYEAPPRSVRSRTVAPPKPPSSHEAPLRSVRSRTVAPPKPVDDGTCELDLATQDRISGLHATLGKATHYELLGVARNADKKVIKNAYFGYVATLHPDRHFRKKLGPFKRKLEELFIRMTSAHETLSRSGPRAEYDRGLPPVIPFAAPPESVSISTKGDDPPPVTLRTPDAPVSSQSRSGSPARIKIPVLEAGPASGPVRIAAAVTDEAPRSHGPSSSGVSDTARAEPLDGLRRFFADKVKNEGRQRARVFAEAGEYELARGNAIGAVTQFQFAVSCCDEPELRRALEAVEGRAQAQRFDINFKRAEAAERDNQWAEAVTCYTKAHGARAESRVAERLANAIRMVAGDLRQAAKLAEEAVQQEPKNVAYRLTLGEVYADAGLVLRAEGEAKRAVELAPKDPRAQALMTRVAKAARSR